jgi:hypothetical protein
MQESSTKPAAILEFRQDIDSGEVSEKWRCEWGRPREKFVAAGGRECNICLFWAAKMEIVVYLFGAKYPPPVDTEPGSA